MPIAHPFKNPPHPSAEAVFMELFSKTEASLSNITQQKNHIALVPDLECVNYIAHGYNKVMVLLHFLTAIHIEVITSQKQSFVSHVIVAVVLQSPFQWVIY